MNIVRCNNCGWIGRDLEARDYSCPECGEEQDFGLVNYWNLFSEEELKILWDMLEDVCINDNEEIEEDFLGFEAGTYRDEVWQWFDEHYSGGVAKLAGLI